MPRKNAVQQGLNIIQYRFRSDIQAASDSGRLDQACTPIQARRIRAYYLDGLLLKEIAWDEAVDVSNISRSIHRGLEKLEEPPL